MLAKMRLLGLFLGIMVLGWGLAISPAAASSKDAAKEAEALVNAAVKLIQDKGEAAFTELNAKGGPWSKGATSIFVTDEKGNELVNPAQPQMVGKNFWNHRDSKGNLLAQEQWKLVKAKGEGWLESSWVKPGTDKDTPCRTFVKGVKVKNNRYLVGAAYYLQ